MRCLFLEYCEAWTGRIIRLQSNRANVNGKLVNFVTEVGIYFYNLCSNLERRKNFTIYQNKRTWQEKSKRSLCWVQFGWRQRHFIWPKTNGRIESILMCIYHHMFEWVWSSFKPREEEEKIYFTEGIGGILVEWLFSNHRYIYRKLYCCDGATIGAIYL
jgi:hypothetical protein